MPEIVRDTTAMAHPLNALSYFYLNLSVVIRQIISILYLQTSLETSFETKRPKRHIHLIKSVKIDTLAQSLFLMIITFLIVENLTNLENFLPSFQAAAECWLRSKKTNTNVATRFYTMFIHPKLDRKCQLRRQRDECGYK